MVWARQGRTRGGPWGWKPGRMNRQVQGAWIVGTSPPGPDSPAVTLCHQQVPQVGLTTLCLSVLISLRGDNNVPTQQICKAQSWSGKGLAHLIRPRAPVGSPWCLSLWFAQRPPGGMLRCLRSCAGHTRLANWPGP